MTPAQSAQLKELVRYGTLAPSSHNTQCWRFHVEQQAIAILPDLSRRCQVVDPDDHHLYVSLGCAAENILQAAKAQGLSGQVSFDAAGDGSIRISFTPCAVEATPLFEAIAVKEDGEK